MTQGQSLYKDHLWFQDSHQQHNFKLNLLFFRINYKENYFQDRLQISLHFRVTCIPFPGYATLERRVTLVTNPICLVQGY